MDLYEPRRHNTERGIELVLSHPEVPLDAFESREERTHALGAWLYVRWLDDFLRCRAPGRCTPLVNEGIWPLLRETFRRINAGEPATSAVRAAMDDRAPVGTFDETVALFWADSLGEHTSPRPWAGPFAPGAAWSVTGDREERTITVAPLAAEVIRVAVSASPARVTIYAHGPAGTRQRVFVLAYDEWRSVNPAEYAGRGFVTDLCSGPGVTGGGWGPGTSRGTGSTLGRWPGELPLAIVNTASEAASWQLSVIVSSDCSNAMP